MNRVFKTAWSSIRQQYVVTDEHHAAKGKATKSAVAIAVAALLTVSGAASAAYVQGSHALDGVNWAKDAEYQKDWGLRAMNASKAYELGFYGQDVKLGIVDSGSFFGHSQLQGQLIDTSITGKYGSTGNRYQKWAGLNWGADHENPFGSYKEGDAFDRASSDFALNVNDSHGTHVAGTIVGKRDGSEFHGVSFGSKLIVGNTGGTDNSTYSPILTDRMNPSDAASYSVMDYNYFKAVYAAVAESGAKFINNSWGTNARVRITGTGDKWYDDSYGYTNFDVSSAWITQDQVKVADRNEDGSVKRDENNNVVYKNSGNPMSVDLDVPGGYIGEWFLYKKAAASQVQNKENAKFEDNVAFVDAMGDVAKKHNIVQVVTTGNRNEDNPYLRAGYANFRPEFEKNWVAVAGVKYVNEELYYISNFNDAGYAKWWTVAAPGNAIYSSAVVDGAYVTPGKDEGAGKKLGDETYAAWGGTSMAAPHVTGALGVLASRYPYMEPTQVRDVMFTTANQNILYDTSTEDGKRDQKKHDESFVKGVPSVNFGWGVPDLDKGMYGPGQLIAKNDVKLRTYSDHWSNDISQIALDARRIEDKAELAAVTAELQTANGLGVGDEKDAKTAYYTIRKTELEARRDGTAEGYKDYYVGSISVTGEAGSGATLVLTGENTFRGGVEAGKGATVVGFAESFGSYDPKFTSAKGTVYEGATKTTTAKEAGTDAVEMNEALKKIDGLLTVKDGGRGGVIASYVDEVTDKGSLRPAPEAQHGTAVTVEKGGTLLVHAASTTGSTATTVKKIEAVDGALVSGWAQGSDLAQIYNGGKLSGTVTFAEGDGTKLKATEDDMLFFNAKTTVAEGGKSVLTEITRDETKSFGMFARNGNQRSVAQALEAKGGAIFEGLLSGNQSMFDSTLDTLDNDLLLNAQNAAVLNTLDVAKTAKDQALRRGVGSTAELAHGATLWATGIGNWGSADHTAKVDADFYAALVGADIQVGGSTTLGAFFGAGTTDFDAGRDGKIDSDDIHYGLYGKTDVADVASISYGVVRTEQDREGHRPVSLVNKTGYNAFNTDADITTFYVEGAYTGLDLGSAVKVEPYAGFAYIRASADGIADRADDVSFTTKVEDQTLQAATLGVRGDMPFTAGSVRMALKGDLSWSHFFGDTQAEARLGGDAAGKIVGAELSNLFSVGLGIEANVGKSTTFGLSYTGNFSGDVTSNGLSATVRYAF